MVTQPPLKLWRTRRQDRKVITMKKISAIVLFFCFHALLIFFEVHKQSNYLKLSYEIQKLQTQLNELTKQKSTLTHTLYTYQQPCNIKDIAEKKLFMKPIELKDVKKIS